MIGTERSLSPDPRPRVRRRAFLGAVLGLVTAGLLIPGSLRAGNESGADVVLLDLSAARAAVDTPYTYAYEIKNDGPDPASDVHFSTVLDGSFSFSSISTDVGTCVYASSSQTAQCDIGGLAAGASATIEIVVSPLGQMNGTATATSTVGQDPDESNNGGQSTPAVLPAGSADLWVYPNSGLDGEGVGGDGYVIGGEPYDYFIDVVNYGPAEARDVILSVVLPAGADFDSADADCTPLEEGDGSGFLVTCELGTVETGRTVKLTAIAPVGVAGQTVRTEMFVDGSGPDPGPQPNGTSSLLSVVPGLSALDAVASERAGVIEVPIDLSEPVGDTVTVDYATVDGTATSGADYSVTQGTVTFAPFETSQVISIPLLDDRLTEPDETFAVLLSNVNVAPSPLGGGPPIPTAALVGSQGSATILDDDPKVRITDSRVVEGDRGRRAASFRITLSHASPEVMTVRFATANSTALAGSDYVARRTKVQFAPGQRKYTVSVTIKPDLQREGNERFFAMLSRVKGAVTADRKGKAVIVNDD